MRRIESTAVLAAFAMVAALGGCATVRESYAPDGRKAYALNCSGMAMGWDTCLAKAGEICQSAGYDVLDRVGEGAGSSGAAVNGTSGSAYSMQSMARSMLIACKGR